MLVRVRRLSGRWINSWFSMALVFLVAAVAAGIGLGRSITQPAGPNPLAVATTQNAVLESGEWLSEGYWQKRRVNKLRARQATGRDPLRANPFDNNTVRSYSPYGGNYRTVCVRLCDGYYFPISASTTRNRFGIDEQACQSKCSSNARLFFYSNAGGSPETMQDRRGRAYIDLKTAFSYRTVYDKSCQCRADPWSEEAKQRHAMYATKGWQKRARRLAKLTKRRARRLARGSVIRPAPPTVTLDGGQNSPSDFADAPPSSYSRLAPQPSERALPRQRYSQARMGLGQPAAVKRQQPRQRIYRRPRSKSWHRKIFDNTD